MLDQMKQESVMQKVDEEDLSKARNYLDGLEGNEKDEAIKRLTRAKSIKEFVR